MRIQRIQFLAAALAFSVSQPALSEQNVDQSSEIIAVKIPVTDINQAAEYYSKIGGFRIGLLHNARERTMIPQSGTGVIIILVQQDTTNPENHRFRSNILIQVKNASQIKTKTDAIGAVSRVITIGNSKMLYTSDPDGNTVQFVERLPASGH